MSSTSTVTLSQPQSPPSVELQGIDKSATKFQPALNLNNGAEVDGPDVTTDLPTPSTAVEAFPRWNKPRSNVWRLLAAFFSFFVLGLNDGTTGPLIPYLETYYNLNYTIVSLIFLSPFIGYSTAALVNNTVHMKFGQRGIAIMAPLCHLITYVSVALHPPYPVIVVMFTFAGFGNGLLDAAWCAWTGNMVGSNKVQGFLQAFYSLGATLSPLISTTMISKAALPWYSWYYVMIGVAAIELVTSTWAFWHKSGAHYRAETARMLGNEGSRTREAIKNKVTWICAAFFFGYVGAEVALGGWIVTFMLRVRSASHYASGMSATGFWLGMTFGRAILGFITEKFGERLCVTIYLAIALGLELIFWLVPQFVISAVAVALLGFFLGPLFPAGIVMAAKLLPRHLHVSAIGFATAIAGTGGAAFPFAVGAIAQAKGVQVLQPIILAVLVVISLLWLSLPRVKKRE